MERSIQNITDPRKRMKTSKIIISVGWSLAFMAGFYVVYFFLSGAIVAHFPYAASSPVLGDVLGWIALGVGSMLGLLGLILGFLGKLPGTKPVSLRRPKSAPRANNGPN